MSKPFKFLDLKIESYTEKSIVVRGEDTKNCKDALLNFGGKFNDRLTDKSTGDKFTGWVFPKSKQGEVETLVGNIKKGTVPTTTSDVGAGVYPNRLLSTTRNAPVTAPNNNQLYNDIKNLTEKMCKTDGAVPVQNNNQLCLEIKKLTEKMGKLEALLLQIGAAVGLELEEEEEEVETTIVVEDSSEDEAPPQRLLGRRR